MEPAKRFILSSSVSDEFVDRFRQRLAALKMGDPLDESTGVAPLSSVNAAARLDDQVNRSVAGGARVILGGKRPSADSAFFEPTILTNVEKGTPAYDEELFGPVAAVMTVPDEETERGHDQCRVLRRAPAEAPVKAWRRAPWRCR